MHTRRKSMIAMIKIAQKQLNIDDYDYRSLLMRVAHKRSCAEMDGRELAAVIKEMKRLGFEPVAANKQKRPAVRPRATRLLSKIEAILADNSLPWSYADAIAKRMYHVDKVQWLSDEHMHKVIGVLQIYADRKEPQHVNA